jgi:hypothetical protein
MKDHSSQGSRLPSLPVGPVGDRNGDGGGDRVGDGYGCDGIGGDDSDLCYSCDDDERCLFDE